MYAPRKPSYGAPILTHPHARFLPGADTLQRHQAPSTCSPLAMGRAQAVTRNAAHCESE